MSIEYRRVVVGITGGIAAYKIPALIRLLQQTGIACKVVCTPRATEFVGTTALRTLTGYAVYLDTPPHQNDIDHIKLAEWGEVLVLCPATANTIAKIAHGIADNLLCATALCFHGRMVLAPAMNTRMWEHPATQENISIIRKRGDTILPVEEGELACGTRGPGRMTSIETIAGTLQSRFGNAMLAGKRVLIGSGPTCEPVDSVRVLTNQSSGAMGAALAAEAACMGAAVTVVTGPSRIPIPRDDRIRTCAVTTTREMREKLLSEFPSHDICIMAAAVSDFHVAHPSDTKIHRTDQEDLTITLKKNPDILKELGAARRHQLLAGFALEDIFDEERAREKLAKKKCDLLVLNTVGESLGTSETRMTLVFADGTISRYNTMPKQQAASKILQVLARTAPRPATP